MNDPNGPMFDASTGLYHLFYQWNPESNVGFSDMHWGHAVSKVSSFSLSLSHPPHLAMASGL